jgi:hypothetical protein
MFIGCDIIIVDGRWWAQICLKVGVGWAGGRMVGCCGEGGSGAGRG